MLRDFEAIDFETANEELSSVCSVGIVVARDGIITDRFYSLIQPEPNYFNYWNSTIHRLTDEDTENEAVFPKVWEQIETHIEGLPFGVPNFFRTTS